MVFSLLFVNSVIMSNNKKITLTYEELYQIGLDVINLGMSLRQNQLNGWTDKSGNEVLSDYLERYKIDEDKVSKDVSF